MRFMGFKNYKLSLIYVSVPYRKGYLGPQEILFQLYDAGNFRADNFMLLTRHCTVCIFVNLVHFKKTTQVQLYT